MPVKRSGIAAISDASIKRMTVMKHDVAGEPLSKTFTIACPVSVVESDQLKIGGFLERCHYCKRRIAQNSEVFMYSNLAFCSAECRDIQVELDRNGNERRKDPKRESGSSQGI
ncbi:hypothetical protein CDL12_02485 [Handroanthus impetiginosus]|uniref:FLZ-type domain-containing protein n=1 Tax=Handroanthus impetiginosus TaxID=429701 RepID=A0A2G9I4V7_9LAMI|nr:hypothetical protein CDL12_02485 [Handroanthus impetiginosus]